MNCVFFTLISLGEIVLSIVQELQEEKKKSIRTLTALQTDTSLFRFEICLFQTELIKMYDQ